MEIIVAAAAILVFGLLAYHMRDRENRVHIWLVAAATVVLLSSAIMDRTTRSFSLVMVLMSAAWLQRNWNRKVIDKSVT